MREHILSLLTRTGRALPATFLAVAVSFVAHADPSTSKTPASLEALVKAAKAEGELNVIGCPRDWTNYGEIFQKFTEKYGIRINELNPQASSGEEIEAIKTNRFSRGRQAPDVIDVGLSFGPQLVAEKLVVPYKVRTWDTIPNDMKHKDGYWYGDFYGVLAFEVNTDVVKVPPRDWKDLLKPDYRGMVALTSDPRTSAQAFFAITAMAMANGGSVRNILPGLQFLKQLKDVGNFVPVGASAGTVASGETPITIRWDYNAIANRDKNAGNPGIAVIIPNSYPIGGLYIQAISAYAPHPNAARLYEEFLYSDEGQLLWLKGYGHPVRLNDLIKRKVAPDAILAKLPPSSAYANAVFPTNEDLEAAKKTLVENWGKYINVEISGD